MTTRKSDVAHSAMIDARLDFAFAVIALHAMSRFDNPYILFDKQNERIQNLQNNFEAAERLFYLALEDEGPEALNGVTPLHGA